MKGHLKRLTVPETWFIKRKEHVFITRPNPGKHSTRNSLPFVLLLKDFLNIASTTKEAKKLLVHKEILVDGIRQKDIKAPVGFMDTIHIKDTGKCYHVTFDRKGRICVTEISKDEAGLKTCRVIGKKKVKGGKVQINLFDGRNILAEKDEYKPGDSLIIEVPSQKIVKHLKLEKGAHLIIIGGKNLGREGIVDSVKGNRLVYTSKEGRNITIKEYGFVVEK